MHMADALISPAVGATMWAATAVTTVYCAKKVREEADQSRIPLMGVLGAFVFAAQMVNFTIPGTGSSGHLGGGLLLAILLGPEAAFLVIASVLSVQALFFADGGLLALGCNIFNLGFFPAFVAYPLVYKRIVRDRPTTGRILTGSMLAAIVGLGLGALGVVIQTTLSGVSALPFAAFATVMLPIHFVIALVEGAVTAGVVVFVYRMQPEILARAATGRPAGAAGSRVLVSLAVAAVLIGAVLATFASANPDGLEWAIERVTGGQEVSTGESAAKDAAESVQQRTALFPGYAPRASGEPELSADEQVALDNEGTSMSGLIGAGVMLALVVATGLVLRRRRASTGSRSASPQ